jgi:3-(3-hydroxy-phenyl)propionate hydroxylase
VTPTPDIYDVHAASTGTSYGESASVVDESTRETLRARYLVGADGGRSLVRAGLGSDMTGTSFPERWLVVDLAAKEGVDAFGHKPYFDFICDPVRPTVSCPQPGGRHRFEFALTPEDDKDHFESDETVHRLLSQHVDPDDVVVLRRLVYTFNALVADRWRDGRVVLAGDAAHMTPQFVGQGMNAGIRDADNLSWKLEAILRHGADPAILDSYQAERSPHAQAMIDFSIFNKSLVSVKNPGKAKVRDAAMWAAVRTPGLSGYVRTMGMKPKPRYGKGSYLGLPRRLRGVEGTLAPQPVVRTYAGRPVRLDDAVGTGWAVIGIGVDPRQALGKDTGTWERVAASFVTLYAAGRRPRGRAGDELRPEGVVDLEDTTGAVTAWLRRAGVKHGSVLVLRPDKFVFGIANGGTNDLTGARGPARPAASGASRVDQNGGRGFMVTSTSSPNVGEAADRLLAASATRTPCAPVRDLIGPSHLEAAYAVQQRLTVARVAAGAIVVGRKIGLTSAAVREQLGVDQPDFGVLFDDMHVAEGTPVPMERLLQPKVEAEIAFVLRLDLDGDVSPASVRAAVDHAVVALEIVDSCIAGWDISFADTVADNASSGLFVLGAQQLTLAEFEPRQTMVTVYVGGEAASAGTGAACLGDPVDALAWLAATARDLGDPLRAGHVVLSGALGPMVAAEPGSDVRADLSSSDGQPLGTVRAVFSGGSR